MTSVVDVVGPVSEAVPGGAWAGSSSRRRFPGWGAMRRAASAGRKSRSSVSSGRDRRDGRSSAGGRGAGFVVCARNEGYAASLEVRKVYRVLPDPEAEAHGMLRVVDESAEDYLFPAGLFVPVSIPARAAKVFE